MSPRYAIGIDLGTTNSVLAYVPLEQEHASVELLPIPQLVAAATIENRAILPSFCYLATEAEAQSAALKLPWEHDRAHAVGEFARRQSADTPTRTIAAAKSWLAYSRVDRHDAILPWNAPGEISRISPVEATRRYLTHLAAAWQERFPDDPMDRQYVVLTVPASFDAGARELTWEAARQAGLPENMVLLEEPQAAVYAWIADVGEKWREQMNIGETLLVCDVGGGTSDFSLIGIDQEEGDLVLRRLAVGNHILVGGDNMDLALAHFAREGFQDQGLSLDVWQSVALWHSCRNAKEQLLSDNPPESFPVTVLGRGTRLIKGTVSVELRRDAAMGLLMEGFFPECPRDARVVRRPQSGFREIGLPFESDTAITRHLAEFLRAHGESSGKPAQPTHILFNGGVFKSPAFRDRIVAVVGQWLDSGDLRILERSPEFDFAVAKGAAYYSYAKHVRGIRIRGGTARSYYVGIETAGPAVPGVTRPIRLLCVVPFGMEEGTEIDIGGEEIGLIVGQAVLFRFFSSSVRKDDRPGEILDTWDTAEISETDSLEAHLPSDERFSEGYVPVRFRARITELGMFELWCRSTISDDLWKLQFSVRSNANA